MGKGGKDQNMENKQTKKISFENLEKSIYASCNYCGAWRFSTNAKSPKYLQRYCEESGIFEKAFIAENYFEAVSLAFWDILSNEAKENLGAILADIEENALDEEAQREADDQRKADRACYLVDMGVFDYFDRCKRLKNGLYEYYDSQSETTATLTVYQMARIYDENNLAAIDC